jgi:hypothetical protein
MFLFGAATSVPTWISAFGALLTGFAALLALGLVGLNESRKLRSQHRQDERRRLQALIGRYQARCSRRRSTGTAGCSNS